uniref:Putative transcript Y 12 protein n=1 Tax=Homo sapiens TaxID=9606 RepID=TTY12_HUMAN|nr:PUTATIVE PSEUDOGENE: RecName: Full=Putative transcript Y 12 protein [Homo sapiens]AAK13491.1 transcript Y 12 [Homo sapiens]
MIDPETRHKAFLKAWPWQNSTITFVPGLAICHYSSVQVPRRGAILPMLYALCYVKMPSFQHGPGRMYHLTCDWPRKMSLSCHVCRAHFRD